MIPNKDSFPRLISTTDIYTLNINTQAAEYLHKARDLAGKKRYNDAIKNLDKAIEIDPEYGTAYAYRAIYYFVSKQYEKAIVAINKHHEIGELNTDEYADDFETLGDCYFALGDIGKSLANYNIAIAFESDSDTRYIGRGKAYLKKGKLGLAMADFDKAAELNPENPDCYYYRTDYFVAIKRDDLAAEDLRKVIEITKDNVQKKDAKLRLNSLKL